jgi:hypothetical protein
MTVPQVVFVAIASATCWTILISRAVSHATDRIIKRMDELEKTLEKIQFNDDPNARLL